MEWAFAGAAILLVIFFVLNRRIQIDMRALRNSSASSQSLAVDLLDVATENKYFCG